MNRTRNEVQLGIENLETRLVPAATSGTLAYGATWAYDEASNTLTVHGTAGKDYIKITGPRYSQENGWGLPSQTVRIETNNNWTEGYSQPLGALAAKTKITDTGIKITNDLKIVVDVSQGGDNVANVDFNGGIYYRTVGDCVLTGGAGKDHLYVEGARSATIHGGAGNDWLWTYNVGKSLLYGGEGNDRLIAGGTGDVFSERTVAASGGKGTKQAYKPGTVVQHSASGELYGGNGDDTLTIYNAKNIKYIGGAGADLFQNYGTRKFNDLKSQLVDYNPNKDSYDGWDLHPDAGA
jgi:hypothetical protein